MCSCRCSINHCCISPVPKLCSVTPTQIPPKIFFYPSPFSLNLPSFFKVPQATPLTPTINNLIPSFLVYPQNPTSQPSHFSLNYPQAIHLTPMPNYLKPFLLYSHNPTSHRSNFSPNSSNLPSHTIPKSSILSSHFIIKTPQAFPLPRPKF